MDNKNGAGPGALEKFFAGKGFYIVLLLCAAVIGVSAWSLLSGREAMQEADVLDVYRPAVSTPLPSEKPAASTPAPTAKPTPAPTPAPTAAPTPAPTAAPASEPESYAWPVQGGVERPHSLDELMYDKTMGDWRTHNGIDIAAPLGALVGAAAAGTVTDITDDPLYGTTVTISHAGGSESVYSNLAAQPTVEIGDTVAAGETIGSVGDTAICESGEVTHLHFAMSVGGVSVDPAEYLG